uniref:Uncharacterized protein n=1 Tax=Mycosarcoma maydis TaxID=5270 RepID=G3CJY2_MYCMD|nr:hypothetical protein um01237 [Ustilago maydis]
MSYRRVICLFGVFSLLCRALCSPFPPPSPASGLGIDLNKLPEEAVANEEIGLLQFFASTAGARVANADAEVSGHVNPVFQQLDHPSSHLSYPFSWNFHGPGGHTAAGDARHYGSFSPPSANQIYDEATRSAQGTAVQKLSHLKSFHQEAPQLPNQYVETSAEVSPEAVPYQHGVPFLYDSRPTTFGTQEEKESLKGKGILQASDRTILPATDPRQRSWPESSDTVTSAQAVGSSTIPPLLPATLLGVEKKKRLQRLRPVTQADLRALAGMSEAEFRSQSVQDPTLFSGVSFEAAILYETKVNTFVASLRNTASSSSQQRSAEGDQPAFLSTGAQRDPSTFIRRYFIQRKEAKQVLLPDAAGTRSLFFILLTNHRLVFSRDLSSLVGVWEFASHPQSDKLRLYFRGFHHFYGAEYHTLEQNPQATGSRFWFQLDQTTPLVSNEQLTLRIVRGELGPKTKEQLFSETGEVSHPDIQELIWSKRLDRVLAMKHLIPGRHLFIYQESSKTVAIIRRWKAHARLGAYSFELRPLLWQQVEDIPFIASARFRKPQAVKVVTEKDGEMFMLAFSARLDWLADYLPSAVAVWQIGPEIQGSRLMICRGFFNLNRGAYDQLTPQSVPGLRDSTFQYNMLGLP